MPLEIKRLKKRRDFLKVAKTKLKAVTPSLIMQIAKTPEKAKEKINLQARLGFTVSKKVGNAVKRNRVRRRLKEAARQVMPEYAKKDNDYVIIGRYKTTDVSFEKIKSDIKFALRITHRELKKTNGK